MRALLRLLALRSAAAVAFVLGVWLRWEYTLVLHHPRHSIFSDGMPITELAELLADPGGAQKCFHTVWPPGAPAYLALTIPFDPTLGWAAFGLFVASCAVPLLVASTARRIYGPRAGWIALILASLDFIFVQNGAHFLYEAPFQLAVALALWASVRALGMEREVESASPATAARWQIVAGVVCGAAWGLAFCFRSNALPVHCSRAECSALAGSGAGDGAPWPASERGCSGSPWRALRSRTAAPS